VLDFEDFSIVSGEYKVSVPKITFFRAGHNPIFQRRPRDTNTPPNAHHLIQHAAGTQVVSQSNVAVVQEAASVLRLRRTVSSITISHSSFATVQQHHNRPAKA
jgi:hypothetical protein